VSYRVGDYAAFRRAMLRPLAGESALAAWAPGAEGDLAVQAAEWWAYVAEVLAFYNERAAQEVFLRTATERGSVARLVRVLGYRPRPAIAARGTLAAHLRAKRTIVVQAGVGIQSKPPPGQKPEVFEVDRDATLSPGEGTVVEPRGPGLTFLGGTATAHLLGRVDGIKKGDRLLLATLDTSADVNITSSAIVRVTEVAPSRTPSGQPLTRVGLTNLGGTFPGATNVGNVALLRSHASTPAYSHGVNDSVVLTATSLHLDSVVREISSGDVVWLDRGSAHRLVKCSRVTTTTWYANAPSVTTAPQTAPTDDDVAPFPVPHSVLTFPSIAATTGSPPLPRARYDFRPVGTFAEVAEVPPPTAAPVAGAVTLAGPGTFEQNLDVLVEDATDRGVLGKTAANGSLSVQGSAGLKPPMRAHLNLLPVSRGKTVAREVLGSGDPTVRGQSFVLAQSPLTRFPAEGTADALPYRSTLRVRVDGVEWREVPTFFGEAPDAQVYVTREDDDEKTHVVFGDGERGALLPAGAQNVVASYRHGAGRAAPPAGTITSVLSPIPGLAAVRNPVAVTGGEDRDPAEQIRRYAPRSALTFDRAVSADDFEVIAAGAEGVDRVRASYSWSGAQQRAVVKVYVDGEAGAVSAVRNALQRAGDPTRTFEVATVTRIQVCLAATLVVAGGRVLDDVRDEVVAALSDPEQGLFGRRRAAIGDALYDSEIYAACHRVAGVAAVEGLTFGVGSATTAGRHSPGEGKVYVFESGQPVISTREEET